MPCTVFCTLYYELSCFNFGHHCGNSWIGGSLGLLWEFSWWGCVSKSKKLVLSFMVIEPTFISKISPTYPKPIIIIHASPIDSCMYYVLVILITKVVQCENEFPKSEAKLKQLLLLCSVIIFFIHIFDSFYFFVFLYLRTRKILSLGEFDWA